MLMIPSWAMPPERCHSPGASLSLAAPAATVKPLADVSANYTCSDSHKKLRIASVMVSPPSQYGTEEGGAGNYSIIGQIA